MYARKPEPVHPCACASALTPSPAEPSAAWLPPSCPSCRLQPVQEPKMEGAFPGAGPALQAPLWLSPGLMPDLQRARLCPAPAFPRRVHTGVRATAPLPSTAPASVPFVSWSLRLRSRPLHWAEGCDFAETCVLCSSPHRQSGALSGLPRHPQRSVASLPATKEPLHTCSGCARAPL